LRRASRVSKTCQCFFIRNSDGEFVAVDVAGTGAGQGTFPEATNQSDTTAGAYEDANGESHSFVRSRHGRFG
jgi:hypothetical protein